MRFPQIPSPTPPEKRVNWEVAKACLVEIDRKAPDILQQGIIIGGIACWFYRHLLDRANDPDFRVPQFSAAEEQLWLSKDIDFTNFFAGDARQLLNDHVTTDAHGHVHLEIGGVRIGFAQVGVTFDPEAAWAESWIGTFKSGETTIQCRILDPISLYREKQALLQKRGALSDNLHFVVVAEFIRFEACRQVEVLATKRHLEARSPALKFLMSARDRCLEVCDNDRLRNRVLPLLRSTMFTRSELKLVREVCHFPEAPLRGSGNEMLL